MAASVLGKRTRKTFDTEVLALPVPARKRRLRNATPCIHKDEPNASGAPVLQNTRKSCQLDETEPTFAANVKASHTPDHSTGQSREKELHSLKKNLVRTGFSRETEQDENAAPGNLATPTSARFKDAFNGKIPITPSRRLRLGSGLLTPRTSRTCTTPKSQRASVYTAAKALFTQAGTPSKLIGRDFERQQLVRAVSDAIDWRKGGCVYVSGPPGTGKSALVREVFDEFQCHPSLQASFINCVTVRTPKDIHLRIVQDFLSNTHTDKTSQEALSSLFLGKKSSKRYLVVLDEIDSLLDSECSVLYTLFNWALDPRSNVILIGIANALDLTDRFLPRLKACNLRPQLLPFHPYTAKQIAEIISTRLRSILPANTSAPDDFVPFMHPAAIHLGSKKVASQTGDVRKAFSLVRRAIEQIEKETLEKSEQLTPSKQPLAEVVNGQRSHHSTPVKSAPSMTESDGDVGLPILNPQTAPRATIAHVARISSAIFNNSTTSRLGGLNLQQKAVLCSLVAKESAQTRRDPFTTPSKSDRRVATVNELFHTYMAMCKRDDCLLQPLKISEFRDVVASLETLGLIHEFSGRASRILTPAPTPSRVARNPDEKQVVSGVSKREMMESLTGPGTDLLLRMFDE